MGGQLHWLLQLQILLEHAILRLFILHHDCCHLKKSSIGGDHPAINRKGLSRLQSCLLDDNSLHSGSCIRFDNNDILLLPPVADKELVHNDRVLREEGQRRVVQTEEPLWPRGSSELLKHFGIEPSLLVESVLQWSGKRKGSLLRDQRRSQRKNDRRFKTRVSSDHSRVKTRVDLTF